MNTDGALKLVPAPDPAAESLPAGLAWIGREAAMERLGISVGQFNRRCLHEWHPAGKARKARSSATGQQVWEVHESADPGLAPIKHADQLVREFDRNSLNLKQRAVYDLRKGVLDRWEQVRIGAVAMGLPLAAARATFCERLKLESVDVSPRTLIRWEGLLRQGPEFLVDGRSEATAAADQAKATDPFLQEVARLWLRQSRPKVKTCHDHVAHFVAHDHGWIVPSLKTTERYLKSLPPQLVIKMREGETAFTNKVLPHVRRDYSSLRSNDWWCSDHHQFDVVVEVGRDRDNNPIFARPWITVWQDLRSRKILAYSIFAHAPNQTTVLHTFRAAALAVGIPHNVLIDNGKDYDCYTLQGMTKTQRRKAGPTQYLPDDFGQVAAVNRWEHRKLRVDVDAPSRGVMGHLKINVTHALPYKARSKPVERFFGTLCTRFSKFVPCYCGRNPQECPEELPTLLKAGHALTLDDFMNRFDLWLEADYHANNHEGSGLDGDLNPTLAFERFTGSKRAVSREALELLIQRTSEPLTVTANGVTFDGLTYGLGQIELLYPYFGRGKQVYLRVDPEDVTQATAWTLDDRPIGLLTANGSGGYGKVGDAELRRAKSAARRVRTITREFHELGSQRNASTLDLVGMQRIADARAAQAAREAAELPPAPLQLVTAANPVMEQAARQVQDMKVQRATRRALAAPADLTPEDGGAAPVNLYDVVAAFAAGWRARGTWDGTRDAYDRQWPEGEGQ